MATEYIQICRAVGLGFVVMGFIGYFVKLVRIYCIVGPRICLSSPYRNASPPPDASFVQRSSMEALRRQGAGVQSGKGRVGTNANFCLVLLATCAATDSHSNPLDRKCLQCLCIHAKLDPELRLLTPFLPLLLALPLHNTLLRTSSSCKSHLRTQRPSPENGLADHRPPSFLCCV